MPEINPTRFFRFAADHSGLLTALYYKRDRIGEADILAQIRTHAQPGSAAATHVLDQLVSLGFLEQSPAATAEYEMTRHFANLLGVLLRQFRLTSVRVIQAYVNDLEKQSSELSEVVTAGNDPHVIRVLNDMNDTIERLRQDSRNNRDAIIAETVKTKTNLDQLTVLERFTGINRLWESYIIPLRDMIDESKVLDVTLDDLDRVLRWSSSEKQDDPILNRELQGATSRLQRMRREVAQDFHESLQEISPLYNDLSSDTRLVRGAVMALDAVDRQGRGSLHLPQRMGLPVWRMEGQLDEVEIRAYLHDINGYQPQPPTSIREAEDYEVSFYIEPEDLARRAARDLPIADAWTWLILEYPEATTAQILRAHGKFRSGAYGVIHFGPSIKTYQTTTHEISAFPLEVTDSHA